MVPSVVGVSCHTCVVNIDDSAVRPLEQLVAPPENGGSCRSPLGTFAECPLCGGDLFPEHAHFKCKGCGWRDSCCD